MSEVLGYRGYVSSRPVRGTAYVQRVQNLVIRDYAKRKEMRFLLSSTEFTMPGCYMMLEDLLNDLHKLEGIILFSLFMLPKNRRQRFRIYETILTKQCSLHSALEDMVLKSATDIETWEDVIETVTLLPQVPLSDAYQTFSVTLNQKDPFVKALFEGL